MLRAVTTANAGLILVGSLLGAPLPAAFADPLTAPLDAPPEVPVEPWRVPFADDAMILNPHLVQVESWTRSEGGLEVHFTAGPPDCTGVHATVHETAEQITVDLDSGMPPQAIGRMCIAVAVPGTLHVALDGPVGNRQVLTSATLDKPS